MDDYNIQYIGNYNHVLNRKYLQTKPYRIPQTIKYRISFSHFAYTKYYFSDFMDLYRHKKNMDTNTWFYTILSTY